MMSNDEIKNTAINRIYGSTEKFSRREECIVLKLTSPEDSEEWIAFNSAETLYEYAEAVKNSSPRGHRARSRARYYFKKGWKLRNERTKEQS